ncbi:MAG: hypothetical protein ACI94Y_000257 [Maribacter sp.]|jgi:hypothetical protein
MIWKKRKSLGIFSRKIYQEGKILDKKSAKKVKGGKNRKDRIWNGCGGIIPQ